ncbi:MAG: Gfo/Idh/MocA family oxidoreductase [Armatimonadetes bacterium]|nr:Gfo/Idh/MocA family oxidoreductase [Armatimonadota bacterium]
METGSDSLAIADLNQTYPLPLKPLPIVILGTGGIVNDAHLPAYAKAGFRVEGVFDLEESRSRATAEKWSIAQVFGSIGEALAAEAVVFDVAVPPENLLGILEQMRPGSIVLMQKPMGKDLNDARAIRQVCREKSLCAAVNFQLRFSPMMLALKDAIDRGLIGTITDVEVRLNLRTPWELFDFLKKLDRVEIQVHSIHYLDWIRSFLGEPKGVYARTVAHPNYPELKSTKTSAILDYGDTVRCCLSLNHNFAFGPRHQAAQVRVEGVKGAAVAKLGLLLNYPVGEPDELEVVTEGGDWESVTLLGRWFPEAFIGTMSSLQRFVAGEEDSLPTGVEDAYKTMALVEACYESNLYGATPLRY